MRYASYKARMFPAVITALFFVAAANILRILGKWKIKKQITEVCYG